MRNHNLDLQPVQSFLDGSTWKTIVHEAVDLRSKSAHELLDLIHLQIDTLHFFLKVEGTDKVIPGRVASEHRRLLDLISHIENKL